MCRRVRSFHKESKYEVINISALSIMTSINQFFIDYNLQLLIIHIYLQIYRNDDDYDDDYDDDEIDVKMILIMMIGFWIFFHQKLF